MYNKNIYFQIVINLNNQEIIINFFLTFPLILNILKLRDA